jgi:hypothetical protein
MRYVRACVREGVPVDNIANSPVTDQVSLFAEDSLTVRRQRWIVRSRWTVRCEGRGAVNITRGGWEMG